MPLRRQKKARTNAYEIVSDHFVNVNKMVDLGSGTQRKVDDQALTRWMLSFENK